MRGIVSTCHNLQCDGYKIVWTIGVFTCQENQRWENICSDLVSSKILCFSFLTLYIYCHFPGYYTINSVNYDCFLYARYFHGNLGHNNSDYLSNAARIILRKISGGYIVGWYISSWFLLIWNDEGQTLSAQGKWECKESRDAGRRSILKRLIADLKRSDLRANDPAR